MDYQAFLVPKHGDTVEECQDAWAADPRNRCFALADGASGSFSPLTWCERLVKDFVAHCPPLPQTWLDRLPHLQYEWQQEWEAHFAAHPPPWFATMKFAEGAFATFLGVVIQRQPKLRPVWRVVAVGDTCVFQVRGNELRFSFPLKTSAQFNNAPPLVGSRQPIAALEKHLRSCLRCWRPGDRLWLMTDALAQWFLREYESGQAPWTMLEGLAAFTAPADHPRYQNFTTWLANLRAERKIRNDDVALIGVRL